MLRNLFKTLDCNIVFKYKAYLKSYHIIDMIR
jgi:hypothetical protein